MLIGVFKSNQKLVNVLTLVVTFMLWAPIFFINSKLELTGMVSTGIKWVDVSIAILLIIGQSIYLNQIAGNYKLVKGNSHLTGLMFIVLNSCFFLFLNLNQMVIANTFILVAFHQILKMYNLKSTYALLFNASFLIALATLIYLPSVLYLILLWIALIYNTTPKWRDFIISLIGLSIPILYFTTYLFVVSDLPEINANNYFTNIYQVHWSTLPMFSKVFFWIFSSILMLSFITLFSSLNKTGVRVRKSLIIVVLMFLVGLGTLFLNQFDYLATFLIVSIPLAIIIANFFQDIKKKWLAELLFLTFIGSLILGYFS